MINSLAQTIFFFYLDGNFISINEPKDKYFWRIFIYKLMYFIITIFAATLFQFSWYCSKSFLLLLEILLLSPLLFYRAYEEIDIIE